MPLPRALARRRRSFDPQALDFGLEIAGDIFGAMIVTQLQPMRHPGRDGSKALKRLADREA
jgi:hypothetical protein